MNDSSLLAQLYWIWSSLNKLFLLDNSFSLMLPSECECKSKTLNVLPALYHITLYPTPHTALSIFSERSLASLIWCTTSYRDFLSKSLLQRMMGLSEIDDFLPRAIVKKLFAAGELKSNDQAKIAELAIKELSLSITLLEQCVKHFEKLKILATVLSEMRSKDRARKRDECETKTYSDYN